MDLRSSPLHFQHFYVSFPHERILQVTLNRPEKLNCINKATSDEIKEIWELFDHDESLWVGIITGVGRAFCTGADLLGKSGNIAAPPCFPFLLKSGRFSRPRSLTHTHLGSNKQSGTT